MKRFGIIILLLLCLVLTGVTGCSAGGDEVNQQLVKVTRGDLVVSVSGSGNVEVSNEAELAFGSGGKVAEIYVQEGDTVGEGAALAKLDTVALELAVSQAKLTLAQANVSLETARFNLDRMEDVQEIRDDIEDAEYELKVTKVMLKQALQSEDSTAISYWTTQVANAEVMLAEAQQDLAELLGETEYASLVVDEIIIKNRQVEAAEETVAVAEQSLQQAQKQLDEATITAPFEGMIAAINAEEGDIVPSPTLSSQVIIHLIDPATMELTVDVDEIDIAGVKPGQEAIVSIDALSELEITGRVATVSPLPKEISGLVLYEVKISFEVPADSGIMTGMSADADIVLDKRTNVLLVPDRAVKLDSQGNTVVEVSIVGGPSEERQVTIGISDGFETEIVDGLDEGAVVIVELPTESNSGAGLFGQ